MLEKSITGVLSLSLREHFLAIVKGRINHRRNRVEYSTHHHHRCYKCDRKVNELSSHNGGHNKLDIPRKKIATTTTTILTATSTCNCYAIENNLSGVCEMFMEICPAKRKTFNIYLKYGSAPMVVNV
uniref:Uncharacterized protein n=1 Tax=Glossina pallidipes TaxID=7398 RepID=A0A1A9ZYG5_GLOPL